MILLLKETNCLELRISIIDEVGMHILAVSRMLLGEVLEL
jgi:hypothetical protein